MCDRLRFKSAVAGIATLVLVVRAQPVPACGSSVQAGVEQASATIVCRELDQAVASQLAKGRLEEAESTLSHTMAGAGTRAEHVCVGLVWNNAAVRLAIAGRLAEAEKSAEKSIHLLKEYYPPDDPVFLRPLQIIASCRFEDGEIGRTREAFKRMQVLRIEQPQDRALVRGISAALLSAEGRYREAEAEFLAQLRDFEEAGHGQMGDAGSALNGLGALYIRQERLEDGRRVLQRALSIFTSAPDAVPMDRVKVLETLGALDARERQWSRAEQDLHEAISMLDRLPGLNPSMLARVLGEYAYALRRDHRRQEARSIEARAAVLRKSRASAVIDTTELLAQSKRSRK